MRKKRRNFSSEFKAKIALLALQEQKTLSELATEYELHPNQILEWKKQAQSQMAHLFERKEQPIVVTNDKLVDDLKREIGTLYVELEWLKKKLLKN